MLVKYKELAEALNSSSGPTNALRNSHTGFLVESGKLTTQELQVRFDLCRYEVWLRGQGVDGNPVDADCAFIEQKNPFKEKVMTVRTVHSPGQGIIGGLTTGGWL